MAEWRIYARTEWRIPILSLAMAAKRRRTSADNEGERGVEVDERDRWMF